MLNAMRFGAKCNAFWCKMRGKNKRFGQHFLLLRMQIWHHFPSKRNAKT